MELVVPGLRRLGHRFVLERLRGIAGHRVPAPRQLAGFGVEGAENAANAIFAAAAADEDLPLGDERRAGDCVGARAVGARVDAPEHFAGRRVEGDQARVGRPDIDLALVDRDAAIDDIATQLVPFVARRLGIERPDLFAGLGVDRVDDGPRRRDIHDPVDDDRGRLDAADRVQRIGPGKAQFPDIGGRDLIERAEPVGAIVEAVAQPFLACLGVLDDARVVDICDVGRPRRNDDR